MVPFQPLYLGVKLNITQFLEDKEPINLLPRLLFFISNIQQRSAPCNQRTADYVQYRISPARKAGSFCSQTCLESWGTSVANSFIPEQAMGEPGLF